MTNVIRFPFNPKPHDPEPENIDASAGAEVIDIAPFIVDEALDEHADNVMTGSLCRPFMTDRMMAADLKFGDMIPCIEADTSIATVDGIEWQDKHVIIRALCTINGAIAAFNQKHLPDDLIVVSRWMDGDDMDDMDDIEQ